MPVNLTGQDAREWVRLELERGLFRDSLVNVLRALYQEGPNPPDLEAAVASARLVLEQHPK